MVTRILQECYNGSTVLSKKSVRTRITWCANERAGSLVKRGLAAATGYVALGVIALGLVGDRQSSSLLGEGWRTRIRFHGVGIVGHLKGGKRSGREPVGVVSLAKISNFSVAAEHRGQGRIGCR